MTPRGRWLDQYENGIDHLLGNAIECVLAATLIFSPLAFGATDPWSEQVVLTLVGALLILFLLQLMASRHTKIVWTWAYVPVAVFVLCACLQLLPLPMNIVEAVSPSTVATKTELLGGLFIPGPDPQSMTLSFYAHATWHDLRLVLAIAGVFVVVLNCFRDLEAIKRLLGCIAAVGGVVALVAIGQFITQTDKIYWLIPSAPNLAGAGPFVNHSNFAQFMNLSVGAALALLFIHILEQFGHQTLDTAAVMAYLSSRKARLIYALLAIVIFGLTAIFVSLSRGGIISLLVSAAFITLIITIGGSQKGRGQVIAIMLLGVFACVLYIGFDVVYERLSSLGDIDVAEGGRWQIICDAVTAWTRFPFFGTGLGTHSVVYPMFDSSTTASLAAHAENEYVQVMEEMGLIGSISLLFFGLIIWRTFFQNIRSTHYPTRATTWGLGFGLTAIQIHSLSDFGQHLPANALLSATFCALMLSVARQPVQSSAGRIGAPLLAFTTPRPRRHTAIHIMCLVILAVTWTYVLIHANQARTAEAHWARALHAEQHLSAIDWQGTDEQYVDLLTHVEAASHDDPDNVHYRHWLNVYRWRSISRVTDPYTGDVIVGPESINITKRIIDEFKQTCCLCPTYGPTYCVLGELEMNVLNDPHGLDHIRTGYRLAPHDATICLVAAYGDAQQGLKQQAFEKLNRAVQLNGKHFQEAATICLDVLNDPNLAFSLTGDNMGRVNILARLLAQTDRNQDKLYETALRRTKTQLEIQSKKPEASAAVFMALASVYTKDNELETAIDHCRQALMRDYSQGDWHFHLAKLLAAHGQLAEAMHEARICLRLQTGHIAAKRLIEELSVRPETVAEN
jgi:O-antigen ligase/tetratricopeptide (TPR) repeat protein